jgi:hypothetical protein
MYEVPQQGDRARFTNILSNTSAYPSDHKSMKRMVGRSWRGGHSYLPPFILADILTQDAELSPVGLPQQNPI